ncbi:MAG: hypothetical protein Q4D14_04460, partial [Bacteroidales bacterium]|nr:hypothetical protein [Bacteroidales bacterium]
MEYEFPNSKYYRQSDIDIFERMNNRHSDTCYYRKCIIYDSWLYPCRNYACFDIESIVVTCVEDFDEQHPAGSILNDIIRFVGITPIPYIKSGYEAEYNWESGVRNEAIVNTLYRQICTTESESSYTHLIDKPLVDVTRDDMMLLGGDTPYSVDLKEYGPHIAAFLVFTRKPTLGYKQPMKVYINGYDGSKNVLLELPVEVIF